MQESRIFRFCLVLAITAEAFAWNKTHTLHDGPLRGSHTPPKLDRVDARNPLYSSVERNEISNYTMARSVEETLVPPFQLVSPSTNATALRTCNIPKLVGDWQYNHRYRFPVAEAQGGVLDERQLLIVSGFLRRYKRVTSKTFTLDITKRWARWIRRDDHPIPNGLTHAAFAAVAVGDATAASGTHSLFFMCGGYVGGHPGPHTDRCFVLDVSQPRHSQWSSIASLPDGGRAGGGMLYDTGTKSLFFTAGAQRLEQDIAVAVDCNNTWMYSFDNPTVGWVSRAPIPFRGNHVSFVTATDATGLERHYVLGGQEGENEWDGNRHENYEYSVENDAWIERAFLPIPRGHAASSTRAVGCGFLVAAGTTNGGKVIADVSYYDIPSDTWTSIGTLPAAIKTPVCDLRQQGMLYCESGFDSKRFSHKIRIQV